MEKLDLYDLNKQNTHKTYNRSTPVPDGYCRLVVHCCIFNSEGKMLIQKRSKNKHKWASLWDISVGGAVSSGETSQQAISREIKEELGIDIDFSNTAPDISIFFKFGYNDIYIVNKEIKIEQIVLQQEEVDDAKYASLEEINEMMKEGTFVEYQPHFMDFLFQYRKNLNIFIEPVKNI